MCCSRACQALASQSSSQYKGVTWDRSVNKWRCQKYMCGKSVYLGCFATEQEAAEVHDAAVYLVQGR